MNPNPFLVSNHFTVPVAALPRGPHITLAALTHEPIRHRSAALA